jgi:uncharacterized protein
MAGERRRPEVAPIRRRDRAVEDEAWIGDFLRRAAYCTWARVGKKQPLLHIAMFAYDEAASAIYLHTGREGRTPGEVRDNDRVALCVSEMGRLLPATTAGAFSVEYASVMISGRVSILADEAEATRALQMLLDKYFPHLRPARDYRPITKQELAHTRVYRIDIEQWSGKRNEKPADYPGAFRYGEVQ